MNGWRARAACAVAGVAGLVSVGGCVGIDDVEGVRDRAAALAGSLEARAEHWEGVASGLERGDPRRVDAEALAAAARAQSAALESGLSRVDPALERAKNPGGMAGRVLKVLLPWLPAPARGPVALGAGALAAGLRSWQLKRALASIVKGLDTAIREDGAFASRFKAHANTFRAVQTPIAKRVVDRVAGRGVTARVGG